MGTKEQDVIKIVEYFAKKLPRFSDGRIDYSKSDVAPVVTVFIRYKGKVLLLKRSDRVGIYPGKWNTVTGYLDEVKTIREKVLEEIREEIGIGDDDILSYDFGESYEFKDVGANKTWIVHPVLVELKDKPVIRLDWEHTEYRWIKPDEIKKFDIVPRLDESLKRAIG
jgi:isopentenyldiphosphate isomerase